MSQEDILTRIQADLVARCKADAYLRAVPILGQDKGYTQADIDEALGIVTTVGGKCGACIVILQPLARDSISEMRDGPMTLTFAFRVLEEPVINTDATSGTGKRALALARRLVTVFDLWKPIGMANPFKPIAQTIKPVEDDAAQVCFEVEFETSESDTVANSYVSTPSISYTGTGPYSVTITCPTAGSVIYYTTDGTYPWSGNGTLYSSTFSVAAGTTVRAVASKTDWIDSDAQLKTIG